MTFLPKVTSETYRRVLHESRADTIERMKEWAYELGAYNPYLQGIGHAWALQQKDAVVAARDVVMLHRVLYVQGQEDIQKKGGDPAIYRLPVISFETQVETEQVILRSLGLKNGVFLPQKIMREENPFLVSRMNVWARQYPVPPMALGVLVGFYLMLRTQAMLDWARSP